MVLCALGTGDDAAAIPFNCCDGKSRLASTRRPAWPGGLEAMLTLHPFHKVAATQRDIAFIAADLGLLALLDRAAFAIDAEVHR